ncbi:hypothetical protein [Nisaea denitrificans]|uniref:hypothetical protein n=1 Tax=Nisaea denitrificans TaxID=390877 RepID=UPI0009FD46B6|nr:hypothetical protein [Nisaea denitrificans]
MKKPQVVTSRNSPDGLLCVDVFRREDGSFGFEEFRRDPEDASGWYGVGGYSGLRYASAHDADKDATARVSWYGNE